MQPLIAFHPGGFILPNGTTYPGNPNKAWPVRVWCCLLCNTCRRLIDLSDCRYRSSRSHARRTTQRSRRPTRRWGGCWMSWTRWGSNRRLLSLSGKIYMPAIDRSFFDCMNVVVSADHGWQVCIGNDDFCIKNDELCIKNDEFCITARRARPLGQTNRIRAGDPRCKYTATPHRNPIL